MLGPVDVNNSLHTQFARAQPFLPKSFLSLLAFLKYLFEEFLCWFTRPCEVFLHRKFGVRGHGLFQCLQICFTGPFVGWAVAHYDLPMTLFCLASAALAVFHRVEAVRSEKRGLERHTWSNGEPAWPIWVWAGRALQRFGIDPNRFVTVSLICRFYEPVLVLVIGISIQSISPVLAPYLIGCSVALFIRGLIVHNRLLNMKRDSLDGRIIAKWIASINRTAGGQGEEQIFVVRLGASAR